MHYSGGFSSLRAVPRLLVNSAGPTVLQTLHSIFGSGLGCHYYLLAPTGIECAPFERSRNRKGQVFTHTRLEDEAVAKVQCGLNIVRIFYASEENNL